MKTVDFKQHLLSIQTELFRFAFKLTADREEANHLLQETSLKALDNEETVSYTHLVSMWEFSKIVGLLRSNIGLIHQMLLPERPVMIPVSSI